MSEQLLAQLEYADDIPKKVVSLGGGQGLYELSRGMVPLVEKYGTEVTNIVTMFDDGGATGKLRVEYPGLVAVGDARQSLVGLSALPEELSETFQHRLKPGMNSEDLRVKGQAAGNIMITALYQKYKSMTKALDVAGRLLDSRGRVLPASEDSRRLIFTLPDGTVIHGEHKSDEYADEYDIPSFEGADISFDKTPTRATPEAVTAIMEADVVVLSPGSAYTSIGPVLAVEGIGQALRKTKAARFMVANLMNGKTQTAGFTALTFASEYERIAGGRFIDRVIVNEQPLNPDALAEQMAKGSTPVDPNVAGLEASGYVVRGYNLLSDVKPTFSADDAIAHERADIRHNPYELARAILDTRHRNGFHNNDQRV